MAMAGAISAIADFNTIYLKIKSQRILPSKAVDLADI